MGGKHQVQSLKNVFNKFDLAAVSSMSCVYGADSRWFRLQTVRNGWWEFEFQLVTQRLMVLVYVQYSLVQFSVYGIYTRNILVIILRIFSLLRERFRYLPNIMRLIKSNMMMIPHQARLSEIAGNTSQNYALDYLQLFQFLKKY